MNKQMVRNVIAAGLVAISSAVVAPVIVDAQTTAAPARGKYKQFAGTIEVLDAASRSITIKAIRHRQEVTKTFQIPADAEIRTTDKQPATLGDFKVGGKAVVQYSEEGGKLIVSKLLLPPQPPAEEKPAEKATN